MPDTCYVCGREATAGHALGTCVDCGSDICYLHTHECDGTTTCPQCYRENFEDLEDDVDTTISGKISSPPTLASFGDVEAEFLDVWEAIETIRALQECIDIEAVRERTQTGEI